MDLFTTEILSDSQEDLILDQPIKNMEKKKDGSKRKRKIEEETIEEEDLTISCSKERKRTRNKKDAIRLKNKLSGMRAIKKT